MGLFVFRFFKTFFLIFIFLGVILSACAMQNEDKNCLILHKIYTFFLKFFNEDMPDKENCEEKKFFEELRDLEIEQKIITTRAKANNEILNILETVLSNNNDKIEENSWEKVKKYLNQGANPNIEIGLNKESLLLLAVKNDVYDMVKFLICAKADVNQEDANGCSPLECAINNNATTDIAKLLINHGANINKMSFCWAVSPLEWAIDNQDNHMIRLLIDCNVNVNQVNSAGYTPLDQAIANVSFLNENKSSDIIKELCSAKASLIDRDGNTAFHLASLSRCPKKVFDILLIYGYPNFESKVINDKEYEKLKGKVILAFRIFTKNNLSREIRAIILSKILSENDLIHYKIRSELSYNSLCNRLSKRDERYNIVIQVNRHIRWLGEILQQKNDQGKNALQLLPEGNKHNQIYIKEVSQLLDINELYKNYNHFNEEFPTILDLEIGKKNLVCKIYNKSLSEN